MMWWDLFKSILTAVIPSLVSLFLGLYIQKKSHEEPLPILTANRFNLSEPFNYKINELKYFEKAGNLYFFQVQLYRGNAGQNLRVHAFLQNISVVKVKQLFNDDVQYLFTIEIQNFSQHSHLSISEISYNTDIQQTEPIEGKLNDIRQNEHVLMICTPKYIPTTFSGTFGGRSIYYEITDFRGSQITPRLAKIKNQDFSKKRLFNLRH